MNWNKMRQDFFRSRPHHAWIYADHGLLTEQEKEQLLHDVQTKPAPVDKKPYKPYWTRKK